MALTSITTVRDRGGLTAASVPGAVTDGQVSAAIALASHTMIVEACGFALYSEVAGYDDTALADTTPDPVTLRTKAQKKDDFVDAESYFAMMHLQQTIAQAGKLTETGVPQSMQVGREVKTFAPVQESMDNGAKWEDLAYTCLKPYLTLLGTDNTDGVETMTFVANKKNTMLMSIV